MESKASLILTILFLAALGGGGYYFYQNTELGKKLKAEIENSQSLQGELNSLTEEKSSVEEDLKKKREQLDHASKEHEKTLAKLNTELEKQKESENKYKETMDDLKKEINDQRVKISQLNGVIKVQMENKILFPSGEAVVSEDGKAVLQKVASSFARIKEKRFRIEGHTDNIPINNFKFPSNWELSATRAANVLHVILKNEGLEAKKFEIVGMGEHHPVAANDTEENRALNRRIEILLIPNPEVVLKKSIKDQ
ncbi:MAG: OmpA family protein [Lentisphaeraceae bacterium]|nr:OmpA family protein [Lentisphaeraceae bacterium]